MTIQDQNYIPEVIATASFAGTTDGTTNRQAIGSDPVLVSPLLPVEPEQSRSAGRRTLDESNHLIVCCAVETGAQDWLVDLEFSRNFGGDWEAYPNATGIVVVSAGTQLGPVDVRDVFPQDALTTNGLGLADNLAMRCFITPGQGVAADAGILVSFVAPRHASQTRKRGVEFGADR